MDIFFDVIYMSINEQYVLSETKNYVFLLRRGLRGVVSVVHESRRFERCDKHKIEKFDPRKMFRVPLTKPLTMPDKKFM